MADESPREALIKSVTKSLKIRPAQTSNVSDYPVEHLQTAADTMRPRTQDEPGKVLTPEENEAFKQKLRRNNAF